MAIYVGNISFKATEEDIRDVFSEYGEVKSVKLPVDRETGRMRGFAFVELSSESEEQAAIEALDGAQWLGRDLRVNKAQPKPTGRRDDGGGGGGGGGGRYGGGGGGGERGGGGGNRRY